MFFSVVILVLPRVAPKRGVVLAEFAEQNSTWPGGTGGTT
jgi:hypothetical protein